MLALRSRAAIRTRKKTKIRTRRARRARRATRAARKARRARLTLPLRLRSKSVRRSFKTRTRAVSGRSRGAEAARNFFQAPKIALDILLLRPLLRPYSVTRMDAALGAG